MGVAVCFGRSKVINNNNKILILKNLCWLHFLFLTFCSVVFCQDVLLICCTPEWISQNHLLASCRMVLRSQNILGLNRAPCLVVFLERLPLLLQEQYSYERVIVEIILLKFVSAWAERWLYVYSLNTQSHVATGDQLVHSAFLQSLASLAVGLSIEKHLCRLPRPPHHSSSESDSYPSEWSWLASYATTVQTAEAIATGTVFPESFIISELQDLDDAESVKALVRCDNVLPDIVCCTNDVRSFVIPV